MYLGDRRRLVPLVKVARNIQVGETVARVNRLRWI